MRLRTDSTVSPVYSAALASVNSGIYRQWWHGCEQLGANLVVEVSAGRPHVGVTEQLGHGHDVLRVPVAGNREAVPQAVRADSPAGQPGPQRRPGDDVPD